MTHVTTVAVIGCGWAGVRHAQAFRSCGAEVTWSVDVLGARATALSAELGNASRVSTDYREALADQWLDAVDICLPHNLHAEVAVAAAAAGKHILCEKPIAAALDEADAMIAAAETAGVVLMIAENERFSPLTARIRALLDASAIGRPALLQMTRECYLESSFMQDRPWFLNARAAAGGMMMSGGVHDFETARMLLGDVASVYALRAPQRFVEMEGDDTSAVMFRFTSEAVGVDVLSYVMKSLTTAAGSEVHSIRIDGTLGSIRSDDGRTIHLYSEKPELQIGERLVEHVIHVPEQDTFLLEANHFLASIRFGTEPVTSGRAQRRPLEIVLAAYRSMETGLPVAIPPA